MKEINALLLTAAMMVLFTSACKKDENGITVTRVINVEINSNGTYTYNVPHAGDDDDVMQIQSQASHFLTSKITPVSKGDVTFEYIPPLNYSGADEVLISNEEGSHGNGGKGGHGNCSGGGMHHHDDVTVYDFKITIKGTATRTTHFIGTPAF